MARILLGKNCAIDLARFLLGNCRATRPPGLARALLGTHVLVGFSLAAARVAAGAAEAGLAASAEIGAEAAAAGWARTMPETWHDNFQGAGDERECVAKASHYSTIH